MNLPPTVRLWEEKYAKVVQVACSFMVWPIKSQKLKCGMPEACVMDILQVRLNIGMLFLEIICISYISYPPTTFCPDVQATMRRRGSGIAYLIGITIVPQLRLFKNRTTRSSLLCLYAICLITIWHIIEYIYIYTVLCWICHRILSRYWSVLLNF